MKDQKQLVSVSAAAKFLKISPETLRLWDRKGILKPFRTKGGQRRYSLADLEAFRREKRKSEVRLNISEAAKQLGIHPETLRRWEREGVLRPERTAGGQRRYTQKDLANLLSQK